jgi:hypothetical protein
VKNWHIIVAVLYGLILVAMLLPLTIACFHPVSETMGHESLGKLALEMFIYWPYWLWLVVMVISQAALLAVPVNLANKRPITKKILMQPVVASALMMGLLVAGFVLSAGEMIAGDALNEVVWCVSLAALLLSWAFWMRLFRRWSEDLEPENFIERQCRLLFKGSVLELLIAVPTHIVARCRDYCCAGAGTFTGIIMGVSVMLFSFGPGVFYLYLKRWKQLHPNQKKDQEIK